MAGTLTFTYTVQTNLGFGSVAADTLSFTYNAGIAGEGVPSGGTTGQALVKTSNADYDTEWASTAGLGTVTSVSVTTANGVSGAVANATTTPAITLTLGAITPTSVNGVTLSGSGSLANSGTTSVSGANSGDQTLANTSDATSHTLTLSGSGGSIQFVEGSNITLTTSGTSGAGVVTIAASGGGGGGSGTVTDVSVVTANGVSGSVATSTTTPAITLTLGAITPSSVNGVTFSGTGSVANSGTTSLTGFTGSGSSSGTNTGDQNTSDNGLTSSGAVLSINGGNPAKFDVAAGTGVLGGVAFSWGAQSAITVTNLATATTTYVSISSAGTVVQSITAPTPTSRRANLFLGQLGHTNNTTIANIINSPDYAPDGGDQFRDFLRCIGIYSCSGNSISANGANLSIDISAGELFGAGINQDASSTSPNNKDFSSLSPATFRRRTVTGLGANSVTTLDVANYDNGTAITSISGTKFQNQRVYRLTSGNIIVQYGRVVYTTMSAAIEAIASEVFEPFSNVVEVGAQIGIITVRSNATDLSDTAQARFSQAIQFGGSGSNQPNEINAETMTTFNGILKGNGSLVSTAVAGTDYVAPGGALGTPSSGTLTSCTGLPISTGVSGLGTSIATALAVNVGSAGAVVVNGGALGTPSSGTLTNCTGLPTAGIVDSAVTPAKLSTAAKTRTITVTIGDGTNVPTVNTQTWVSIPFACTITKATLLADASGSAVIGIWKDTYANYPPVVGDSITASAPPTISSAIKSEDSTLTGWTTSVTAGDILLFNLNSVTTCKRLVLSLEITLT